MITALITLIEFFCGSLMFSYWLGLAANTDLKAVGDVNPGAYNLWQSAGYKFGIVGVCLDFMKGYLPLAIFLSLGYIKGIAIVPVAIAPVLGHAFSPFLKFKGGKAIAVTFGVWSAVTGFEVALVYAVVLAIFNVAAKLKSNGKTASTETDAVMVVLGMVVVFVYLVMKNFSYEIIFLCLLNFLIITYTNRMKLYSFYQINFRSG
jgi:glycerol-3-phosphate acyltransferase PlsY